MKLYKDFNISKSHKKSLILIGNFDGIHLGHQRLFKLANKYKKKFRLKIGVVTFDPMPKMYFNKKIKNFRLSSISQKNKIMSSLGVDFVVTKKFDKNFSKTKSNFFIKEIIYKKLEAKYNDLRLDQIKQKSLKSNQKLDKEQIKKIENRIRRNKNQLDEIKEQL